MTAHAELDTVRAVEWREDTLYLLDQRRLPGEERYLALTRPGEVAEAIADLVVRGAPAIGIAAAYAVVLAVRRHVAAADADSAYDWRQAVAADIERLHAARPTAVNLAWALARMRDCLDAAGNAPAATVIADAQREARRIHDEDIAANRRMGELGAGLIGPGAGVLTHCNTGSLATGGYGTALGVIRSAYAAGRLSAIYAGETRPWLQGARLTAWELARDGIPGQLIADAAGAYLMAQGRVQWVIVGADRIAANGDVANKIGTYQAAVAARHHGLGFMVVAPTSTLDLDTPDGSAIAIEERAGNELLSCAGAASAPVGARAWNPVFDITPAELVDVLVTEAGVVERPDRARVAALLAGRG